ncbi:MAG: class I SAM-dependent methyltransferase [Verrucomicrobia bacterium]|nr:class I SAM-dependent methyltransferase [Verrucomicrobiota bacterium]
MNRVVEPEILDDLKPDDPRAIRARRDLQRINWWMGNARLIARSLQKTFTQRPPVRIVEIGTGDGTHLLRVAEKLPWASQPLELTLIDREPAIEKGTLEQYAKLGWHVQVIASDVFEWLKTNQPSDCIIANLFLHHFSEEQLRFIFSQAAAQTRCFIGCEPLRANRVFWTCRLMPLIGIGEVALNDAYISTRAGFCDQELSRLWPDNKEWILHEGVAGMGSHLFVAKKCE